MISGYPSFEAGDHGHIRKRAALGAHGQVLPYRTAIDGTQYVTLRYRGVKRELQVDRLICEAFHGPPPWPDTKVVHKDGILWNHWQSSLHWDMDMTDKDVLWTIVGNPQSPCVWRTDRRTTESMMVVRDILIGYSPSEQRIVAFSMKVSRDETKGTVNPFGHVKYLRATAKMIADIELMKGDSTVPSRFMQTPEQAVEQYRKLADMHPNFMWAFYIAEAADIIEYLAGLAYTGIVNQIPPPGPMPAVRPVPPIRNGRPIFTRPDAAESAQPAVASTPAPSRGRPIFTKPEAAPGFFPGKRR